MKPRNWFPVDVAALLSFPITLLAVMLLMQPVFPVINWLRHPTPVAWLWVLGTATLSAIVGTALLFVAKLPQYRAGIFLRVGCHHLPPRHRRLYHAAFWLIVPSILILVALLSAVHRFH